MDGLVNRSKRLSPQSRLLATYTTWFVFGLLLGSSVSGFSTRSASGPLGYYTAAAIAATPVVMILIGLVVTYMRFPREAKRDLLNSFGALFRDRVSVFGFGSFAAGIVAGCFI